MGPFHATNLDPTYALERDLQLVTLLDRLGFDEAWIGEHHSGGFEIIAAPGGLHRRGGGAHQAHQARHRREVAALSSSLRRGRDDGAARPHDARPRDVRRRARRAAVRLEDDRPCAGRYCARAWMRRSTASSRCCAARPSRRRPSWFELVRGAPVGRLLHEADDGDGGRLRPLAGGRAGGRTARRGPAGAVGRRRRLAEASRCPTGRSTRRPAAKHGHAADRSRWQFAMQMHLAETREQARKDVAVRPRKMDRLRQRHRAGAQSAAARPGRSRRAG